MPCPTNGSKPFRKQQHTPETRRGSLRGSRGGYGLMESDRTGRPPHCSPQARIYQQIPFPGKETSQWTRKREAKSNPYIRRWASRKFATDPDSNSDSAASAGTARCWRFPDFACPVWLHPGRTRGGLPAWTTPTRSPDPVRRRSSRGFVGFDSLRGSRVL